MIELTEEKFEKLMKTNDENYLSYLELFFIEGEVVVARFAGNDMIVLFTDKRIIYFYFPIEEKSNKFFREYRFVTYKSVRHYSVMTGKNNILIGFELSVAGAEKLTFSSVSQQTVFQLSNIINQYTI